LYLDLLYLDLLYLDLECLDLECLDLVYLGRSLGHMRSLGRGVRELEIAIPDAGEECGPLTGREAEHGAVRILRIPYGDVAADEGGFHTGAGIAVPAPLPGGELT
jgi:hypothetical protein